MKKLLLASAAAIGLTSVSAFAADMAAKPVYKAPPPPAPVYSWTGFYLGAGVGYGLYDADTSIADPATGTGVTGNINNGGKGWMARFTAGFDYQFTSNIVGGVFANYDPAAIKGTMQTGVANFFFDPIGGQEKLSSDWAVGARLGWLLTPTILSYADGGYTRAHFNAINLQDLGTGAFAGTEPAHNLNGWFLGSGFTTPIPFINLPGLFLDTEYRHARYEAVPLSSSTGLRWRPDVQTITTSLVYKFNWTGGAPAAAGAAAPVFDGGAPAGVFKAPPAAAPVASWTGFYLGAGVGYGIYDADTTPVFAPNGVPLTGSSNAAGKGWLGKFTVGVDYQFTSNIVGGVFANYDPAAIKGTLATGAAGGPFEPLGGEEKESHDWAVGARVGWLLTPTILTYADGGFTQAHFNAINVHDVTRGTPIGTVAAQNYNGWFAGSGFTTPVPIINIPGLFLDTEYRYASYESKTTGPFPAPFLGGSVPTDLKIRPVVQTVTTSLVYKFNWTGH